MQKRGDDESFEQSGNNGELGVAGKEEAKARRVLDGCEEGKCA